MIAETLEEARRKIPALAGGVVGVMLDNPAQFAVVFSGAYVVTRGLGRLVRPTTLGGMVMTSVTSYAVCWWLIGEARARGLLEFRTRDPATGELVTLEELAAVAAECGCLASPAS
jgi:hypothetical protein